MTWTSFGWDFIFCTRFFSQGTKTWRLHCLRSWAVGLWESVQDPYATTSRLAPICLCVGTRPSWVNSCKVYPLALGILRLLGLEFIIRLVPPVRLPAPVPQPAGPLIPKRGAKVPRLGRGAKWRRAQFDLIARKRLCGNGLQHWKAPL